MSNKTMVGKAGNSFKVGMNATKKATTKTINKFTSASLFVKILVVILALALILFLIWAVYVLIENAKYKTKNSPFVITEPVNAFKSNQKPVKVKKVPNSVDGHALSISFWMYIDDWNYKFGEWKNILIKGNDDKRAPGLWLYPKTNSLHARINTFADYNEGCDIRNIPLQKWVHIAYILNQRTVDIYVDGKLERSCALRGVPALNSMPIQVANDGGFYGQIAKMQYFIRPLEPNEVAEIYSEGPYMPKKFNLNIFKGIEKQADDYRDDVEDEWNNSNY